MVGQNTVLAHNRHDISCNTYSTEIEQRYQSREWDAIVLGKCLHKFKTYTASTQVFEWVGGIFALGVEYRDSIGQLIIGHVVVANDEIYAQTLGITTGGNALKFYASVRLDIRKVSTLKDGDQPIGNQVRVKIVKNKVAPPFRKAEFEITFGEGISKIGEIVDLGVEYEIIKKSGSWFSYGDSKLGQGRDAVKDLLKDNPELCDELEAKIMEKIANKK